MATQASTSQTWRFGVYEVDTRRVELRRGGMPVKIREQSFLILVYLLEHAGDIVTREELRRVLWPSDTFVDFDHSLSTAVKNLRDALGDSTDAPHFIETVPRRGYRFIAPVTTMGDWPAHREEVPNAARNGLTFTDSPNSGNGNECIGPLPGAAEAAAGPPSQTGGGLAGETIAAKAPEAGKRALRRKWVLATAVLVVGGASVIWLWSRLQTKPLTDKDTIVVADFTNTTDDPVFDSTLWQGLTVQLEQSPFLSLISDQRIQQTLHLMGQPADTKLTLEIAREVCQRTGSKAVIDGSIAQIGTQYSLILRAVNCSTGESLTSTEAQASDKSHVLEALGKATSEIRNKLGESLSTVQKFDTPLEQATTPSLEALQAYSLGWKTIAGADSASAIPLFQQAIRLDPNFAIAYNFLGLSYRNLSEYRLASDDLKKAYELRERASEREKLFIEATYHTFVTGDLEKAQRVYGVVAQIYPRYWAPRNDLGVAYTLLG